MHTTLAAPRDGRATTETPTERPHYEHRVETCDGAIELVWTEGYDSVLLVHDDRRRITLDLTAGQVLSLLAGATKIWELTRGQMGPS